MSTTESQTADGTQGTRMVDLHLEATVVPAETPASEVSAGGFDGVLSVEHEDPVWGGTEDKIQIGLEIAERTLRPGVGEVVEGGRRRRDQR